MNKTIRPHRKCPCGSKKKYRNCCGKKQEQVPFNKLSPEMQQMFKELRAKWHISNAYHKNYFGESDEIYGVMLNGQRIVAVNGTLLKSKDTKRDWSTPSDFLVSFLKTTLGDEWLEQELSKSYEETHEIAKWYKKAIPNLLEQNVTNSEITWDVPNGKALALLHLAYDLYVLANRNKLMPRLVGRLKDINNFNGARYEAFVFATLIRAGFEIEYNDEVSGITKTTECRAKFILTGDYITVEAKTRNIKGILGAPSGQRKRINLYDKLQKAVNKPFNVPYFIFIDLNERDFKVDKDLSVIEKCAKEFNKLQQYHPNNLPNLICYTNIPFHYGRDDSSPSIPAYGLQVPQRPKIKIKNPAIITAIGDSLKKYGYLPKLFNEANDYADKIFSQI